MTTLCLRRLPSALLLATLVASLARPAAAGVDRWTSIGPEGGDLLSLAADPDNPGTLYAGTIVGSVWKSLDGGDSWIPTVEGLGNAPVSSLTVSAGRVLAGTYNYGGLYLLTAGASAWRRVGPDPLIVFEAAVDPADPGKIWMTGFFEGGDLFASEDAGESWVRKLSLRYSLDSVAIAPTVPPTLYVGGDEGLYASRDGGISWREFDIGDPPQPTAPTGVGEIEIDPQDPETVYVNASAGFWKTTDGGEHWGLKISGDSRYHLLALPEALLAVNAGHLVRSEDKGETWESVEPEPWLDVTFLAADPANPGGAWLGGRGLFRTTDSGRTWTRTPGRNLSATFIGAFAFDPFRAGVLYTTLTTYSNQGKLRRSADGGATWNPVGPALDVISLTADPRRPATLYASTPRGVAVSRDRGAHWQRLLRVPFGIDAVAVDPHRPGTLWAAGQGFWRSRDAGRTWKRLASSIDPGTGTRATKIFPSPWHPDTLYLIDLYGYLRRSTDGGATWPILEGGRDVLTLAFDPAQQDVLYVAGSSGSVRKSLDGGTTWVPLGPVTENTGVTALLIDRLDPSTLYAGTTSEGVWRSLDRGITWEPFMADFFAPRISCLEADPKNPRRLVACTQGGGLLEIEISPGA